MHDICNLPYRVLALHTITTLPHNQIVIKGLDIYRTYVLLNRQKDQFLLHAKQLKQAVS
jgi:hypothetical protein